MKMLSPVAVFACLVGCSTGGGPVGMDVQASGDAADVPPMAVRLPGETYCDAVETPRCEGNAVATCGVCVTAPMATAPLARTACAQLATRRVYCDASGAPPAPNLGCYTGFDPAHPPAASPSQTVTVWGVVDVFDTGGDTTNIFVEIHEVGANGSLGSLVGSAMAVTTSGTADAPGIETESETDASGQVIQIRKLGAFVIPNVQTEHPYIIRTVGTADFFGRALYDYTLPIRNSAVGARPVPAGLPVTGPNVYLRPRAISNNDWISIPSLGGTVTGIPTGHGFLAGEVHDCDDVRVAHAVVYANPAPYANYTAYFTDDLPSPRPRAILSGLGTEALGMYTMFDFASGAVRVAAVGFDPGGALVHVGSYPAWIFENALTIVTLRGLQPWQSTTP